MTVSRHAGGPRHGVLAQDIAEILAASLPADRPNPRSLPVDPVTSDDRDQLDPDRTTTGLTSRDAGYAGPVGGASPGTGVAGEQEPAQPSTTARMFSQLRAIAETLILTIIIFFVVQTFIAQPYVVDQVSMEQTLLSGESVLVDKLTPRFDDYSRGDVIVFPDPTGGRTCSSSGSSACPVTQSSCGRASSTSTARPWSSPTRTTSSRTR